MCLREVSVWVWKRVAHRLSDGEHADNPASAAIAGAAALLQQIGAAQPLGQTIDKYPAPRPPLTLALRSARIERVLGMRVPDADVPRILEALGFTVEAGDARREARNGEEENVR